MQNEMANDTSEPSSSQNQLVRATFLNRGRTPVNERLTDVLAHRYGPGQKIVGIADQGEEKPVFRGGRKQMFYYRSTKVEDTVIIANYDAFSDIEVRADGADVETPIDAPRPAPPAQDCLPFAVDCCTIM